MGGGVGFDVKQDWQNGDNVRLGDVPRRVLTSLSLLLYMFEILHTKRLTVNF